jgi:hypothetical protein
MKTINWFTDSALGKLLTIIIPTVIFYMSLILTKGISDMKEFIAENALFCYTLSIAILISAIVLVHSYFKNKIIALKKFRDKEMMRVVNHFNTQLNTIENRLAEINAKGKFYEIIEPSINEKKVEFENSKTIVKEIEEYNEAFKWWGCGNYTKDDTKPLIEKQNFDIKTTEHEST